MNQRKNVAIRDIHNTIHEDCLSCGENIIHPLCPSCIAEGFKEWLKKFPQEEQGINNRLNRFLRRHKSLNGNSKTCVACGKSNTHICPYCFTEYLFRLVKEAGMGVRAMTEFLFLFNFDFNHKGYYRELEVYGGY